MSTWWLRKIARGIVFMALALTVFGFAVMALWNALVPAVGMGPEVTFWQADGLLVLSHLLYRGWAPWRDGNGWRHERWRKRFEEKLAAMTPADREKFKEEWKQRCGRYPVESEESRQA